MAGIDSLSATASIGLVWQTAENLTGSDYQPLTQDNNIPVSQAYSEATANTELGGADELVSYQFNISAGASATIDLQALTDILQRSATLVRVKALTFRLLNPTDDPDNGTLASSIFVGNTGAAITNGAELDNGGGTGLTIDVTAVAGAITVATIGTAGSGYPKSSIFLVSVIQSTATQGLIAITTNSSGVPTAAAIVNAGASYTTATGLATFVVTFFNVKTGGVHQVFDRSATGYTVSSTKKNVRIQNMDPSLIACVQVTFIGGQS